MYLEIQQEIVKLQEEFNYQVAYWFELGESDACGACGAIAVMDYPHSTPKTPGTASATMTATIS